MKILFEPGRFYILDDQGKLIGEITYQQTDKVLLANHTFVDPAYRGQNIAGQLLDRLVDYAREEGYLIKPLCSYVVHKFEKEARYDDINLNKQTSTK